MGARKRPAFHWEGDGDQVDVELGNGRAVVTIQREAWLCPLTFALGNRLQAVTFARRVVGLIEADRKVLN